MLDLAFVQLAHACEGGGCEFLMPDERALERVGDELLNFGFERPNLSMNECYRCTMIDEKDAYRRLRELRRQTIVGNLFDNVPMATKTIQ